MEVSDDDDDDDHNPPEIGQGNITQRLLHLEMAFGLAACSFNFMSRLRYLEHQLGVTPTDTGCPVKDRLVVLEEML
jgi:hypothetical protein